MHAVATFSSTGRLKLQSIQIPLTFATFKAQVLDTLTKSERIVSKSLDQRYLAAPVKCVNMKQDDAVFSHFKRF